jgi:peptide/nickel transport system permease protein
MNAVKQYFRKPMGVIGLILLLIVIISAIFAPALAPYDPYATVKAKPDEIMAPPSRAHILGTDDVGKDVFSQLLYGARVSLLVGFSASIMSMVIGTLVGMTAGYFGGRIGNLLMRLVDFLLVIPSLPLMMVIVAVWGRGIEKIILVIGLLGWTYCARLARSQVISIKERPFILRAKAIGVSQFRIIFRHVFPLILPIIIAETVLDVSSSILAESSLSFLGLGDPTVISWGSMLNFAFKKAISQRAWWYLLPPGFAIIWVSVALVLIGNTIDEIVNPRLRSHHLFDPRRMVSFLIGSRSDRVPPVLEQPETPAGGES